MLNFVSQLNAEAFIELSNGNFETSRRKCLRAYHNLQQFGSTIESKDYIELLLLLAGTHFVVQKDHVAKSFLKKAVESVLSPRNSNLNRSLIQASHSLISTLPRITTIGPGGRDEPSHSWRIGNPADLSYGNFLHSVAAFYQSIGLTRLAIALLHRVVEIDSHILTGLETAKTLNNLGFLYLEISEFGKAVQTLEEALDIKLSHAGEVSATTAKGYSALARAYSIIGNIEEARELQKHSLLIRRNLQPFNSELIVEGLLSLSLFLYKEEESKEVRELFKEATELLQESDTNNEFLWALLAHNKAHFEMRKGNFIEAEKSLSIAESRWNNILEDENPTLLTCKNMIGLNYCYLNQLERAAGILNQVFDMREKIFGDNSSQLQTSLMNLAYLNYLQGNFQLSFNFLFTLYLINQKEIHSFFPVATDSQKLDFIKGIKQEYYGISHLLVTSLNEDSVFVEKAYRVALNSKNLTVDTFSFDHHTNDPSVSSKIRLWRSLRQQVASIYIEHGTGDALEAAKISLLQLSRKKEQLEKELAQQLPSIADQFPDEIMPGAVYKKVPKDAVLVEFVKYPGQIFGIPGNPRPVQEESQYFAFLVSPDHFSSPKVVNLGSEVAILSKWHRYRDLLESFKSTRSNESSEELFQIGKELAELIWIPIVQVLPKTSRLIIAPDGVLNIIPFGIIPITRKSFLIDCYKISYISSGKDLLKSPGYPDLDNSPPIILGAPMFDLRNHSDPATLAEDSYGQRHENFLSQNWEEEISPLPATDREISGIARTLGTIPVSGKDANVSFLRKIQSPRILHLATHGLFVTRDSSDDYLQDEGLRRSLSHFPEIEQSRKIHLSVFANLHSLLLFAGAETYRKGLPLPEEFENGVLTAEMIEELDLRGTKLVVLSACDSGLGNISSGEGVFGLKRSFLRSGAETLVLSLWTVPDDETASLMRNFYENLKSGQKKAEALSNAQLDLRRRISNPYYWGAFICFGMNNSIELNVV